MVSACRIAILLLAVSCSGFSEGGAPRTILGVAPGDPDRARSIGYPGAVMVDAGGKLYVGLTNHRSVLRWDPQTGVAERVAGTGKGGGPVGDHGPALQALLRNPEGTALDKNGNLYIADSGTGRVRMVAHGTITTVAGTGTLGFGGDGGPATSALLNCPTSIAVDAAGNLYIADWGNHRIRMVSDGIIRTIAGDGVEGDEGDGGPAVRARLRRPSSLALDAAGNLYIADASVPRIRMISKGTIVTVAGSGVYGFGGDGGPAKAAKLSNPTGIAIGPGSSLYIADASNGRIRKVAGGIITTVAGNGEGLFAWPRSVAVSNDGKVYIADGRGERVYVVIEEGAAK